MKKILVLVFVAAGLGFAAGTVLISNQLKARHADQLAAQQAAWQAEKADLEAALETAQARPRTIVLPGTPAEAPAPTGPAKLSPAEIMARLHALKLGPGQTRGLRQALHCLEELIAAGPEALPTIREYLALNQDLDLDFTGQGQSKAKGGAVPNDFVLPPSLRFGLFDVVKQIGGSEGEKLLAEVMATTGRGVEVLWLARTLQQIAPNKYKDVALTAARDLLTRTVSVSSTSPLDRNDRDHLFSVLALYGDTSFVSNAQAQLLGNDGQIDRSALKYLQQTLGQQSVTIAAQMYNDPRLTDPAKKEPLARLALAYVGADAQANQFYQKAIDDLAMPNGHRKNLIEDLNQDGFADTKNLTARDLPLIENRISLIEHLAPSATDPVNVAAFQEAYKDLLKMRERAQHPPQP